MKLKRFFVATTTMWYVVHMYAYEMERLKIKRCTDADETFHIKKLTFYMGFHQNVCDSCEF